MLSLGIFVLLGILKESCVVAHAAATTESAKAPAEPEYIYEKFFEKKRSAEDKQRWKTKLGDDLAWLQRVPKNQKGAYVQGAKFTTQNTAQFDPVLGEAAPQTVVACWDAIPSLEKPKVIFIDPACVGSTVVSVLRESEGTAPPLAPCGTRVKEVVWQATDGCQRKSNQVTQIVTVSPPPPGFSNFPPPEQVDSADDIDAALSSATPTATSVCSNPTLLTKVEEISVEVGCGKWEIQRTWRVSNDFPVGSCTPSSVEDQPTRTHVMTVVDTTAPVVLYKPLSPMAVPFFNNYNAANPIPLAKEDPGASASARGFVSNPISIVSEDGTLEYKGGSETCIPNELASFTRTWIVSDACGNKDTFAQIITIANPPPQPFKGSTQSWNPASQLFNFVPGVEQIPDVCAAGKMVIGGRRAYNPLSGDTVTHNCEDGWWSGNGCREVGFHGSKVYYSQSVNQVPPMFVVKPGNVEIFTNESLTPSENPKLGQAAGSSYCDTPFTISYEDAPPQRVPAACGQWTIKRTWKIQPEYADCGGKYAADLTATHVQEITIIDRSAPEFLVLPADQIDIPLYENYRKQEPLPFADEVAHGDMKALGLVSHPIQLISTDEDFSTGETSCFDGLASFTRIWKVMDACGNSAERYQTIVVQHPPAEAVSLQVWNPGQGLSPYAPGVMQLSDKCHPGKRIALGTRVYDRLLLPDSSCAEASSPETGCWTESSSKSSSFEEKEVYLIAPTFNEPFPSDVKRYTNDTLDPYSDSSLGVATGSAACGTPFKVTYSDGMPMEVPDKCGVWTIGRSWKIQPQYNDCGSADASLTQTRVQVITVLDTFAPQFTETPAPDQFVEFLTDYGTSVTGVPVVEDIATHPDASILGLVSYPITLEFEDVNVVFHADAASLTEGLAVVSRQWTAQDRCGNTATWMQTVRVRNPQDPRSHGAVWTLGQVGRYALFSEGDLDLKDTNIQGAVGSFADIKTKDSEIDGEIQEDLTPSSTSLQAASRTLASFQKTIFSSTPDYSTGPQSIVCEAQAACKVTQHIPPTTTTVQLKDYYDSGNNDGDNDDNDDDDDALATTLILEGSGLVYNIFNGLDINDWLYEPLKNDPSGGYSQIVRANGFVIVNIKYTEIAHKHTSLRPTSFEQQYEAGSPFLLYNLYQESCGQKEKFELENTRLTGSVLLPDWLDSLKLKDVTVDNQLLVSGKRFDIDDTGIMGALFAANVQGPAPPAAKHRNLLQFASDAVDGIQISQATPDQLLREIRGHVEHIKDLERQLGTMESENSHTSGYGGMPWTVLSCFAVLMLGIWIGARPTYKTKETPTDLSPCSSCSPVLREPILSLTALTKRFASGSV
jgi:hypothetical protein